MNLRSIDLNLLVVFDMLMQERSTTRAAGRLAMTQSAVSKALARLRATIGDPLFTREPTCLVPTRRAEDIAAPIRQALGLIRSGMQSGEHFAYHDSDRTFRLAATGYVIDVLLHRFLDLLSMTARKVKLRVDVLPCNGHNGAGSQIRDAVTALQNGSLDLVLHHDNALFPSLRCQHLFDDAWEHIIARDTAADIDDAPARGHILTGIAEVDALLHANEDGAVAELPSLSQVPRVVARTDLAALVPSKLLASDDAGLTRSPVDAPALRVYQFWHDHAHRDSAHKWLRQSLLNHARRI